MEESDCENPEQCEECTAVIRIIRAHSEEDENDEESHPLDGPEIETLFTFLLGTNEIRDCNCWGDYYWSLHRLVRDLFSDRLLEILHAIPTRLEPPDDPDTERRVLELAARVTHEQFGLFMLYQSSFGPESTERRQKPFQRMFTHLANTLKVHERIPALLDSAAPGALQLPCVNSLLHLSNTLRARLQNTEDWNPRAPLVRFLLRVSAEGGEAATREETFRWLAERAWDLDRPDFLLPLRAPASGLALALRMLPGPALANRIQALNYINSLIGHLSESFHLVDQADTADVWDRQVELGTMLVEAGVVEGLFGGSPHPELLKQTQTLIDFLVLLRKLSQEALDAIWAAGLRKDCARHVHDLLTASLRLFDGSIRGLDLSSSLRGLEGRLVLRLRDHLLQLPGPQHTHLTVSLAGSVMEAIWQSALCSSVVAAKRPLFRPADLPPAEGDSLLVGAPSSSSLAASGDEGTQDGLSPKRQRRHSPLRPLGSSTPGSADLSGFLEGREEGRRKGDSCLASGEDDSEEEGRGRPTRRKTIAERFSVAAAAAPRQANSDILEALVKNKDQLIQRQDDSDSVSSDRETSDGDHMVEVEEEEESGESSSTSREGARLRPLLISVASVAPLLASPPLVPPTRICEEGSLLWDLIKREEEPLSLDLSAQALAQLSQSLDKFPYPIIRTQFLAALADNLASHAVVKPTLTLLNRIMEPRLVDESPASELGRVGPLILGDLRHFCATYRAAESRPPNSELELGCRLFSFDKYSQLFPSFRLSAKELEELWDALWWDREGPGRGLLCRWIQSLKGVDVPTIQAVVKSKLHQLRSESAAVGPMELKLIQMLVDWSRSGPVGESSEFLPILWEVFLKTRETNISLQVMDYLSNYYASFTDAAEVEAAEEEMVTLCCRYLTDAKADLDAAVAASDEAGTGTPMSLISRGLLMLKSHLSAFAKRHTREAAAWSVAGLGLESHRQWTVRVAGSGRIRLHLQIQVGGAVERSSTQAAPTQSVGQLRAEVAHILAARMDPPPAQPPFLRLIYHGKELPTAQDHLTLQDIRIIEGATMLVSVRSGAPALQDGGSGGCRPEASPLALLSQPERWSLLMDVVNSAIAAGKSGEDQGGLKWFHAACNAWEVLLSLPTNAAYLTALRHWVEAPLAVEEVDQLSRDFLSPSLERPQLTYSLSVLQALLSETAHTHFLAAGGLGQLTKLLMSPSLLPAEGASWNQWELASLCSLLDLCLNLGSPEGELRRVGRLEGSAAPRSSGAVVVLHQSYFVGLELERMGVEPRTLLDALLRLTTALMSAPGTAEPHLTCRLKVLRSAFALLIGLLFSDKGLALEWSRSEGLGPWLDALTLACPEPQLREQAASYVHKIGWGRLVESVQPGKALVPGLLSALLSLLPKAAALPPPAQPSAAAHLVPKHNKEPYGLSSGSFLFLLSSLLGKTRSLDALDAGELAQVAADVRGYLKNRPNYEATGVAEVDPGLVGLIQLQTALIKLIGSWKATDECHGMVGEVWESLFGLPTPADRGRPKAQSSDSRSAAFDLLAECARSCPANYRNLFAAVLSHHKGPGVRGEAYGWDYWPADEQRAPCGLVGLVNLGATCYMATAIQHLYMIPSFREVVLTLPMSELDAKAQSWSWFKELQRIFSFLYESRRKAFNPREFCRAYRMQGDSLNTGEQKDMSEFLTDLISALEEVHPRLKAVVKALFAGTMSNNVVSEDCAHVSQTTEETYTVRVQVAEMADLEAALRELTVADVLEGDNAYSCEGCGRGVKARKRAAFRRLPEILSFNTMRYTFNMISMTKEKVNTLFGFPLVLSMRPYMETTLLPEHVAVKDANEDEGLDYELIGVTVHTGTGEGGHYYAFIRDPLRTQEWYWLNDAEAKSWDVSQLAAECFGGEQTRAHFDTTAERFMDLSFEKANSAYMLFYRRLRPDASPSSSRAAVTAAAPPAPVALQPELAEDVWRDNKDFLHHLAIFEHRYLEFAWELAGGGEDMPMEAVEKEGGLVAELSLRVVLETLLRAKEKPTIARWTEKLLKLLSAPTAAAWLLRTTLDENMRWCRQILIASHLSNCRQVLEKLLNHVLITLTAPDKEPPAAELPPLVAEFLGALLNLLTNPGQTVDLRQLAEFFAVLRSFSANAGAAGRRFLLDQGTISRLVAFYMKRTAQELSEVAEEDSDEELGFLSLMRTACVSRALWLGPSLEVMTRLITDLVEFAAATQTTLRTDDLAALCTAPNFPFLIQQVKDAGNMEVASGLVLQLIEYLGPGSKFSGKLLEEVFRQISTTARDEALQPFFLLLNALCSSSSPTLLRDVLEATWRRGLETSRPVPVLRWLAHMGRSVSAVRDFLLGPPQLGRLIESFLLGHLHVHCRIAAGQLLCNLVSPGIRDNFERITQGLGAVAIAELGPTQLQTLHDVLSALLDAFPTVEKAPAACASPSRLVPYLNTLRACLVTPDERALVARVVPSIWGLFSACMRERTEPTLQNKLVLWQLWWEVSAGSEACLEAALAQTDCMRSYLNNFIIVDQQKDLREYNKMFLPIFYALGRLFAQHSREFALSAIAHDNLRFAVCSVAVRAEYKHATEQILLLTEMLMQKSKEDLPENVTKQFKVRLWSWAVEVLSNSRTNYATFLRLLRLLIVDSEDRLRLLGNGVLSHLSRALEMIATMCKDAPATNSAPELSECLKRFQDFVSELSRHPDEEVADGILAEWGEATRSCEVLLGFLNSAVPPELRKQALDCLEAVLKLHGAQDTALAATLAAAILKAHRAQRDCMGRCERGPYFPSRGATEGRGGGRLAPAFRHVLDMHLHAELLETTKGLDPAYDAALIDYFGQYHMLADRLIRMRVNQDGGGGDACAVLAELSALLALEGLPLHLNTFPKLWSNLQTRNSQGHTSLQPLLDALCQHEAFHHFLQRSLVAEPASLASNTTSTFFLSFLPKVWGMVEDLVRPSDVSLIVEALRSVVEELLSAGDLGGLRKSRARLVGSLRALRLTAKAAAADQDLPTLLQRLGDLREALASGQPEPSEEISEMDAELGETLKALTEADAE